MELLLCIIVISILMLIVNTTHIKIIFMITITFIISLFLGMDK